MQTTLKLTAPGMPDTYQGAELWDLSLVDPDNRRAVDFKSRTRVLGEVMAALQQDRRGSMRAMLENWRDGRGKLAVTAALLAERRAYPALFAAGGYEPLTASGPKADHICAFARANGDRAMIVVATLYPVRLAANPVWDGTDIAMPRNVNRATRWRDVLTGQVIACSEDDVLGVGSVLSDLPVAVLVSDLRSSPRRPMPTVPNEDRGGGAPVLDLNDVRSARGGPAARDQDSGPSV